MEWAGGEMEQGGRGRRRGEEGRRVEGEGGERKEEGCLEQEQALGSTTVYTFLLLHSSCHPHAQIMQY